MLRSKMISYNSQEGAVARALNPFVLASETFGRDSGRYYSVLYYVMLCDVITSYIVVCYSII